MPFNLIVIIPPFKTCGFMNDKSNEYFMFGGIIKL